MIIPVKCFTCGNVLADKYRMYINEVRHIKLQMKQNDYDSVKYLTKENVNDETVECRVLNELHLYNVCCRRHMLTHVDIE